MSSAYCYKIVEFPVCKKMMRSDSLKRHWRLKYKYDEIEVTTVIRSAFKHASKNPDNNDLRSEIVANGMLFYKKINLAKSTHNLLLETNTKEESLFSVHKEALDLYQRKRMAISPKDEITLFLWQQVLFEFVQKSTYHEVIWVKDAHGNEGKT